jgi:hypothetical protein
MKTAPLMGYYKEQGKFHAVNGIGSIDEITLRLSAIIDIYKKLFPAVRCKFTRKTVYYGAYSGRFFIEENKALQVSALLLSSGLKKYGNTNNIFSDFTKRTVFDV